MDTVELDIKVEGMMCSGCSSRIIEAVKKCQQVKEVKVNLESKLASIEVESATILDALSLMPGLVQTIKDLGFEAEPHIEYEHGV